jgi:flagellar hook-length control protein FliK
VKANIIAGINEFQQQVQQGREPGIDLSAIVADAAKDAALSADVVASMTARVDSQASQFLNLMTQTQASAQHAIAGLVNQTESVIQENSQLRAEASKTQQAFEGFDKAVNIHKSDGQQQLGEKIRWMVNARNTMAEIRLDPPELGSMQVRVNVAGDAASVSFVVQSQQAKEALADAMPKLRDMLSEQGIELGDAQVRKDNSSGQENGQQLAGNSHQGQGAGDRGENDGVDDTDGMRVIEQSISRADKGGIDFYA